MEKSIEKLKIKYKGADNEIGIDLFIESLTNYSIVAQEISSQLHRDSKLDIKIKALEKGSFIVTLEHIIQNVPNLFSKDNISYASGLITVIGGIYSFKKWISQNGNPKKVEQINDTDIKISNDKGDITINNNIYSIYNTNPKVRQAIRKTFNLLKNNNNSITGFEILEEVDGNGVEKSIFGVVREDFSLMSSESDETEKRKQTLIKKDQELSLFKVVFGENYKWEFYYNGNKIFVDLKDSIFYKKIEVRQIAFRSGDKLIVELEIEQIFNEVANIFENKSYHILKVNNHIPRTQEQDNLFDFEV